MAATVAAVIGRTADAFDGAGLAFGHGTDNAWDEAAALVLSLTGLPDDQSAAATEINADVLAEIERVAERRIAERVPLAYLLGSCTYAGYNFIVEPGVMVPRSPIGHLVRGGLDPWVASPRRILDLCCGSGCLGLIAAHRFADADVTLLECDPLALDVARRNVHAHALSDRVHVVEGDARAIPHAEPWDLVLTNPPYVGAAAMRALPPEYRAEPDLGLAGGGVDGLDLVGAILAQAAAVLTDEGVLVGEVGDGARGFTERFPAVPAIWLDLPHGGEGVFLIERVHF